MYLFKAKGLMFLNKTMIILHFQHDFGTV